MSSRPSSLLIRTEWAQTYWRRFLSRYEEARPRPFSTSVGYAAARPQGLPLGMAAAPLRRVNPEMVPVYCLLASIALSVSLGLLTAKQELVHCPNVLVDKKKRETLPEVKDPDFVIKKWQDVMTKSFFRRIAQKGKKVLEVEGLTASPGNSETREVYAETLKSVGVDIQM